MTERPRTQASHGIPDGPDALRLALRGIEALLIDVDGVLVLKGQPLPGAPEALARLERSGVPFLLATNTSLVSRAGLAAGLARRGMVVPPERIQSALSAAAAAARRIAGERPVYALVAGDARAELDGLRLLSPDEVDAGVDAAVVLVADPSEEFDWANLQRAFRLLRGGARLVAAHKNRWWLTPAGETIDAGAFVAGLEYSAQVRALVAGKPSRTFYGEAVRRLGVPAAGVAMLGDDLWQDVIGAQRAGLRGILVLGGRHGEAELERAARDGLGGPDGMVRDLAGAVEALLVGLPAERGTARAQE
ncbi:MAG TPA: HAD-IIA family hydrolase [Candidatus Limnocylindrales bacterium]|nr:HAD-IIA family hydrolase [Candidatus Limnocylindrales bacterium]